MWWYRKRIKQRVTVTQRFKRVKVSAGKNKTLTTVVITWLVMQFAGSFAKGLPELNPWLVARYQWALSLNPIHSSGTFQQLIFFNILFWPLAGCVLMIRGAIQYFIKTQLSQSEMCS
ncbi:hypothetical protein GCM10025859_66170 [Alicyclobacillus fastidiosus]|nr:hypothetical protein GCM10025859_63970 [Alicyclobacillus fastidiosus]GMA66175.1 hypothetical protein GCM10025859_66170 [Alicyclobacillus fastidiosus]